MITSLFKIFNILPIKIKRNCFILFAIIIIISLLELLSIGLIIPILNFIFNENYILDFLNKYNFFKKEFLYFKKYYFNFFIILLILFILLKNISTIFLTKTKNFIAANIHIFLSIKLFSTYLEISYDKFILESKSILIKNIVDETNKLRYSFLLIFTIFSEIFISLAIFLFIILLYPKIVFPILILAVGSILFIFFLNKKKVYSFAKVRLESSERMYQLLNDIFFNIKDVLLKDFRQFFISRYQNEFTNYSISVSKSQSISESTKYYVELIFITAFLIFIFFNKGIFQNKDEALIFIAVFLVSSYRILPSINRISQSLSELKNNLPSCKLIFDIFEINKKNREIFNINIENSLQTTNSYTNESFIELKNISYNYQIHNKTINIFSDLNLKFFCGQSIGLQGNSGSGKTTFVNIVSGLLKPNTGEVLFNGHNIQNNMFQWRKNISYISQDIFLMRSTLRDNLIINFNKISLSDENLILMLEKVELGTFLKNIDYNLDYKLDLEGSMISGGQKQRLAIARALLSKPKILILDEATNALDDDVEKEINNLVVNKLNNLTKIIISHKIGNLENCANIYKIENKKFIKIK